MEISKIISLGIGSIGHLVVQQGQITKLTKLAKALISGAFLLSGGVAVTLVAKKINAKKKESQRNLLPTSCTKKIRLHSIEIINNTKTLFFEINDSMIEIKIFNKEDAFEETLFVVRRKEKWEDSIQFTLMYQLPVKGSDLLDKVFNTTDENLINEIENIFNEAGN